MSIWTQDYAPIPGSTDAAAMHARAITDRHKPGYAAQADTIVRGMFEVGLAHTGHDSNLNLITTADRDWIRFELHYPNDLPNEVDPPTAHATISRLASAYGEGPTGGGRMIYAELGFERAATA
ncbi:hypothetical protein ACIBG7_43395 [Nonomuraea sp. NPDC050328]|uniref:hypothetical protein n=1 Tax=Nonomuraea sp. NPDC050328 TaxID=3364361 RepID=UPI0037ACD37B